MKKKYGDLGKNVFLFAISSFGNKVLAFLLVPLYTSFLSTQEYGTIDLMTTTVNLLLPIFSLNIAEAVMRFTLSDKDNDSYIVLGINITLKGSALLVCLSLLLSWIPTIKEYNNLLIYIVVVYFLNSVYNLMQNYLRATERIALMVQASLVNSFVMLVLDVVFIAKAKMGVQGYYLALISGFMAAIVYMECKGNIFRGVDWKCSVSDVKKDCLRYCIPTIFTALAWWINSGLDKYFVTALCGVEQNGIYSIAYKIPTILNVFQNIFIQAWTISAIVEFDKDDSDGFFGKTYKTYNLMMVFVTMLIMVFNIPLSKILYANEFFVAWKYVPTLLVAILFSALSGYLGSVFSAVKDTKICAITTVISAVVNVILNIILIPRYGAMGAAVATVVAYIAAWIIRLLVLRKYIRMKINLGKDFIIYVMLLLQMILASTENCFYICQVILILLVIFIYIKDYKNAFVELLNRKKK